jgi:general secretion pathway protein G
MIKPGTEHGFSLVELLVVIVVIGILAGLAMQSMTASVKDLKRIRTEREMEMLSRAIVGDPSLTQNGARSDFGYVGDIGAFPANLQALYQNPGGLSTWNGPYLPATFTQDSTGFKTDEWGRAYAYSGGVTITSTGGGTTITKKIADAANDYLSNRVTGDLLDAGGGAPGAVYDDSTNITISYPNGAGSTTSKTYHPAASGAFTLDSIPVGTHPLRIVFTPDSDTLQRYVTVLPRNRSEVSYQFATTCYGGSTPAPTCDSSGTLTLRPMGAGVTALNRSGGPTNWQCVDEVAADNGSTYVSRLGSYAIDTYAIEDVAAGTCTITGVTVYARGYKTTLLFSGHLRTVLRIGSTNYQGAVRNLGNSWSTYNDTWATNPATGSAWTWADINSLQAGVSLESTSPLWASQCTQVYVTVSYAP